MLKFRQFYNPNYNNNNNKVTNNGSNNNVKEAKFLPTHLICGYGLVTLFS